MARLLRLGVGDLVYHVLNRGNNRADIFSDDADYREFLHLLRAASRRIPMRILAFCLMPNHFHLVLWPRKDADLSRFMHWLLTTHACRHHRGRGTSGHVWQGRFKAFPIQNDRHLLTVIRYVERNPVRSRLVENAELWQWSSTGDRCGFPGPVVLTAPPVEIPEPWLEWVNRPLTERELNSTREHLARGRPYGNPRWSRQVAAQLGLASTRVPRGRPRSRADQAAPGPRR